MWNSPVNTASYGSSVISPLWKDILVVPNESVFLVHFSFIFGCLSSTGGRFINWMTYFGEWLSSILTWCLALSGDNDFPLGFVCASSSFPGLIWRKKAQHGSVQYRVNYLAILTSDNHQCTVEFLLLLSISILWLQQAIPPPFFIWTLEWEWDQMSWSRKIMFFNQNCLKLWLPLPSGVRVVSWCSILQTSITHPKWFRFKAKVLPFCNYGYLINGLDIFTFSVLWRENPVLRLAL